MVIEISVGIIAFCFVILTIYIVFTLISLRRLLDRLHITLDDVRHPLKESSEKIASMTDSASQLVQHLQGSMRSFDPFFRGLSNAGHHFENLTNAAREKVKKYSEQQDNSHTLMDVLGLLAMSFELWQKSKKRS